jgi:adenylylsulfate kinase-like enzyme
MLLNPSGKLFWVTGLAGAGKSTIGKLLYEHLKKNHPNTIYIDGDVMRWVLGDTTSYSPEDRKRIAFQYARFSKMLVSSNLIKRQQIQNQWQKRIAFSKNLRKINSNLKFRLKNLLQKLENV